LPYDHVADARSIGDVISIGDMIDLDQSRSSRSKSLEFSPVAMAK